MKKVLIPVTNHATLGSTEQANGTYAPELTHVLKELINAGIEYDIASIKGGKAPLYGTDIEGDNVNAEILADDDFLNRINNTIPVSQLNSDDYDAIFYPGGFGLLSDLAVNKDFATIAAKHYEDGGVVASVCHGPAALLPITLSNGEKLLASKSVTGLPEKKKSTSAPLTIFHSYWKSHWHEVQHALARFNLGKSLSLSTNVSLQAKTQPVHTV